MRMILTVRDGRSFAPAGSGVVFRRLQAHRKNPPPSGGGGLQSPLGQRAHIVVAEDAGVFESSRYPFAATTTTTGTSRSPYSLALLDRYEKRLSEG
jgi:hypothetical protein